VLCPNLEGCEQPRRCIVEPGKAQGGAFVSFWGRVVVLTSYFSYPHERFHLTLVWHVDLPFHPTKGIEVLEGALDKNPFEIVTTEPFLFNLCKLSSCAACPPLPPRLVPRLFQAHWVDRGSARMPIKPLVSPSIFLFLSGAETP
jgi:hypothetical protein